MTKTNINLITYDEVLQELDKSKPNNHLLLGNGFNLSLGIKTDYTSIFKKMKENHEDYKLVNSDFLDLEQFIGACKSFIAKEGNPHYEFMCRFLHNKIKLDFMKAVTNIVTKEVRKIYQDKNEELYLLFRNFDNFFTLNYDPFLYQLLMSFKKEKEEEGLAFTNNLPFNPDLLDSHFNEILKEVEIGYNSGIIIIKIAGVETPLNLKMMSKAEFTTNMSKHLKDRISKNGLKRIVDFYWKKKKASENKRLDNLHDGFGLFGEENKLLFINQYTQNLFFIHGAFHLVQDGKEIYKITQTSDKALYQRIEEVVEDVDQNIICIFSDSNKEDEMVGNKYLKNGLLKLQQLEGVLLIIGSSLAENDSHVFERISNSKIEKVFIASLENNADEDYAKANKIFPNQEIVLFDRSTISYVK